MFEIGIRDEFAAAHAICGYNGPCERLHGHNYRVEVALRGRDLDDRGLLFDFREVKRLLGAILDDLDHRLLNDLDAFAEISPTSEGLARYIHGRLKPDLIAAGFTLTRVTVWETDRAWASYSEED